MDGGLVTAANRRGARLERLGAPCLGSAILHFSLQAEIQQTPEEVPGDARL